MNGCLGNIQWSRLGSNRSCFLAATILLGMLHVYLSLLSFFLSLSSIHILRIKSLSHDALRASDRVHFARPPARIWSFTGVRLFRFQFIFSNSFFDLNAMASWRVGAGIWSCALPKNVHHSSPRPWCLCNHSIILDVYVLYGKQDWVKTEYQTEVRTLSTS